MRLNHGRGIDIGGQGGYLATYLRPTFSGVGFLALLLLVVLLLLLLALLVARGPVPVVLLLVEAIVFVSVSPPV